MDGWSAYMLGRHGNSARRPQLGVTAITQPRAQPGQLGRWLIRAVALVSALGLALVISGGIFQFLPGIQIVHARSSSMEPWLKDGDVILMRTFQRPPKVKVGDVVVYHYGAIPVNHRVIEVGPDQGAATRIVVKGDNNPVADKPITLGEIRAKMIIKVPLLGQISRALGAGGGVYVYRYAV